VKTLKKSKLIHILTILCLFSTAWGNCGAPITKTSTGRFLAWDKSFELRLNSHDPQQNFIVSVSNDGGLRNNKLLRLAYFAPTNGLRGGAQFIEQEKLDYERRWTFTYHVPVEEWETRACTTFHNFVLTGDGKYAVGTRGPFMLFQSTQFDAMINFEKLDDMPCMILEGIGPEDQPG
jgi:hypothetical protein